MSSGWADVLLDTGGVVLRHDTVVILSPTDDDAEADNTPTTTTSTTTTTAALANDRQGLSVGAYDAVVALAQESLRHSLRAFTPCAIVLCGDSGGGKSAAAKVAASTLTSTPGSDATLTRVLNHCRVVVDAFCSAATTSCPSASRAATVVDVLFTPAGAACGASFQVLFLEAGRAVAIPPPCERNFAVFYALLAGAPTELLERLSLPTDRDPSHFSTLTPAPVPLTTQASTASITALTDSLDASWLNETGSISPSTPATPATPSTPGATAAQENRRSRRLSLQYGASGWSAEQAVADNLLFGELSEALVDAGLTDEQIQSVWAVVAAVLHLTSIQIEEGPRKVGVVIENPDTLSTAAELLGVNADDLSRALTFKLSTTETLSADQCRISRDGMAKTLYQKLVDWLVVQLNSRLASGPDHASEFAVGVLDIPGFDSAVENSLDQLCVNHLNDKLQQAFVSDTLKGEQSSYRTNGMEWDAIPFDDPTPVCRLIERKSGLFGLLEEDCVLPNRTDSQFLDKLDMVLGSSPFYSSRQTTQERKGRMKVGESTFFITHAREKVLYSANGFIARNKDHLPARFSTLLERSSSEFVIGLFASAELGGEVESLEGSSSGGLRKPPSKLPPKPKHTLISEVKRGANGRPVSMGGIQSVVAAYEAAGEEDPAAGSMSWGRKHRRTRSGSMRAGTRPRRPSISDIIAATANKRQAPVGKGLTQTARYKRELGAVLDTVKDRESQFLFCFRRGPRVSLEDTAPTLEAEEGEGAAAGAGKGEGTTTTTTTTATTALRCPGGVVVVLLRRTAGRIV